MAAQTPPIPLCTGHITYLGINISPRLSELLNLNYTPLLKTITDKLLCWMNFPLSLLGQTATIKMSVLPKVNYLLAMIPSQPSMSWVRSLDSIIKFYWKNKPPRIKLKTLQKPKEQGGLAAPFFFITTLQISYNTYTNKYTHPPTIQHFAKTSASHTFHLSVIPLSTTNVSK